MRQKDRVKIRDKFRTFFSINVELGGSVEIDGGGSSGSVCGLY